MPELPFTEDDVQRYTRAGFPGFPLKRPNGEPGDSSAVSTTRRILSALVRDGKLLPPDVRYCDVDESGQVVAP